MTVYVRYYKEANTAYFDCISLYKDNYNAYTYDSSGNLKTATPNDAQTSTYTYDSSNNLTSAKNADNDQYTYTYNNKHSVTQASSPMNVKYKFAYYDNGEVKTSDITNSSESMKIRTGQALDSTSAYVTKTTDQDGYATNYTYNTTSGKLTSVKTPNNVTTSYAYKANTDLISSVTTGSKTVNYTYDSTNSRLNSITHNGFNYNFTYDKYGNVTYTKVGSQTLVKNTYQSYNGNLSMVEYGNGDKTEYTYGDYDNITSVSKNDSEKYKWYYSDGKPVRHVDKVNKLKYTYIYDLAGRVVQQNAVDTNSTAKILPTVYNTVYKYNTLGNVSAIYNTANNRTYNEKFTYDKDERPLTYNVNSTRGITYSYDSIGRLNQLIYSTDTPIKTNYVYWLSNRNTDDSELYRTTKVKRELIGNTGYAYTYDNMGNILTINEGTRDGTTNNLTGSTQKVKYTYDSYGQLTREDNKYLGKSITYSYNSGGNITAKKEYAYTTGTLGTATSTVSYTYGDTNWKDKLTAYNGQTVTYDAIGNPLSYRGMTLSWQGRQLTKSVKSGQTIKYTYDADGLRASKTVSGTKQTFQYLGGKLMYENRGDGKELYYSYDSYGNLSCIRYHNGSDYLIYYTVCNSRGDVEALYGGSGSLAARYIYDSWGNTISIKNASGNEITSATHIANINRIRYRGYYYDAETGLYYLQSRYYDPVTCRFINADSLLDPANGYNSFAYCGNNPVNNIDPNGEAWYHWALGATIVAGFAVATVVTAGGFVAAVGAVASVGCGFAAATTASTVAAAGLIASSTYLGISALNAIDNSRSVSDFNTQGNWGTVAGTAISGVCGSVTAYIDCNINRSQNSKSCSKLDKYIDNPSKIKNVAPEKIEKIALKENLNVGSLSKGTHAGQGFKVTWGGDRLLQYHPGGGHHGPLSYWKVSSGEKGIIRIFNDK